MSGPSQWSTFLHDERNQRCFNGAGSPSGNPGLKWEYETGEAIWGSPVVDNGLVYIGSYDHKLHAVDVETGETAWTYETGSRIDGSPAVVDGTVYVGSHDRNIYALDAETGEEEWIYGTRGIVRSSPSVVGDRLYIGAYCNFEVCAGYYSIIWPRTGYLYAFDKDEGTLEWAHETSTEGVVTTPAASDEFVYVTGGEHVKALNPATGEAEWTYTLDRNREFLASPTLVDGTVYTAGNTLGDLVALDGSTGEEHWKFSPDAVATGTPVVCNDTVFFGVLGTRDGPGARLFAIDAEDGTEIWQTDPNAEAIGSSAVVVDGIVWVGAHNFATGMENEPGLYGFTMDGERYWHFQPDDAGNLGFGSSPAVVEDSLYIGGANHSLYAFDL